MKSLNFIFFLSFFGITGGSLAQAYHIDPTQISVSGLSAGAYMAEQMQVADSDIFSGLGVFAGGIYNCSHGDLNQALLGCSSAQFSPPNFHDTMIFTYELEKQHLIAPLSNLQHSKIYIYRGKKDPIISAALTEQNIHFFETVSVPADQILYAYQIDGGHGLPTLDFGNECFAGDESPYLNHCQYDGAGEMLQHLYGPLKPKTKAVANHLFSIPQRLTSIDQLHAISMAEKADVYVPSSCELGQTCRLHVAFHGCLQTTDDIQDQFYTHAGYNEWAEANNIIVLYPQAEKNIFLNNPKGCWDWWGYTGPEFETRQGAQIQVVMNLIKKLSAKSFSHTPHIE